MRPREARRTTMRPLALPLPRTAAAAEARTPGGSPGPAGRRDPAARVRTRPSSRRGPLLEPSKITVKAVCDRRPTGTSQGHQVHVHAKTTLTVIFHRSIRRRSEGWPGPDAAAPGAERNVQYRRHTKYDLPAASSFAAWP